MIEFWVDNSLMLEMLTPEMQAEYQRSITPENWKAMLAHCRGHAGWRSDRGREAA